MVSIYLCYPNNKYFYLYVWTIAYSKPPISVARSQTLNFHGLDSSYPSRICRLCVSQASITESLCFIEKHTHSNLGLWKSLILLLTNVYRKCNVHQPCSYPWRREISYSWWVCLCKHEINLFSTFYGKKEKEMY